MRIKNREANVAEVNMTPMIDIVFQLIAFFMVITNFENTRADERVKLPVDRIARPTEAPRDKELVLNVGYVRDKSGAVSADSPDALLFHGDGTTYPLPEVGPVLAKEKRYFEDLGTVEVSEVAVVIRADAEVPTGEIQNLIAKSQEQGFSLFQVKAESPE